MFGRKYVITVSDTGSAMSSGNGTEAVTGVRIIEKLVNIALPPEQKSWDERILEAADRLTHDMKVRVKELERRQDINDPYPLNIRYRSAGPAETDHAVNVFGSTNETLANVDDVIDLYPHIPSGRLVILGQRGSGKSVLVHRLALRLAQSRAPGSDEPVPAVINLNSWDPGRMGLRQWIIERLLRDFNGLKPTDPQGKSIAKSLVERGLILPLLDGFDEVTPGVHVHALQEINDVALPVILTSRSAEYRVACASSGALRKAATVVLNGLPPAEVASYLPLTTSGGTDQRWRSVVADLEGNEASGSALAEALSSPLMVSLARKIYSIGPEHDPARLLDPIRFHTAQDIETHLLTAFVPAAYRWPAAPDRMARQVLDWRGRAPGWLAGIARRQPPGDYDLAWWRLGGLLAAWQRTLAFLLPAAVVGAVTGILAFGVLGLWVGGALLGALAAIVAQTAVPVPTRLEPRISGRVRYALVLLLAGITGGTVLGLISRPAVLAWGWGTLPLTGALGSCVGGLTTALVRRREPGSAAKPMRQELSLAFGGGLIGGAVVWAVTYLAEATADVGYGVWIGLCCVLGLSFSVPAALEAPPRPDSTVSPADLLSASRRLTILMFAGVGLAYGLALAAFIGPARGLPVGMVMGAAVALGSTSWGRWVVLVRCWLPLTGQLPWPVWAFLDDAHERGVLRQSGAVYQFRHGSLQSCLARRERDAKARGG